jgi:hypothetical protein
MAQGSVLFPKWRAPLLKSHPRSPPHYFLIELGLICLTDVGEGFIGFVEATFVRRTIPARAPRGDFDFGLLATNDFSTGFEMTTCFCGCPCALEVDDERTSVTAAMKTSRLFMTSY